MIVSEPGRLEVAVRAHRLLRGWSQEQLAAAAGLSRAGVSAIEVGRLVPSTAAALAMAAALGCRVEDLFRLADGPAGPEAPAWAWAPSAWPARCWRVDVGPRRWLIPAESTLTGLVPHDGVSRSGEVPGPEGEPAPRTLVLAGCDPAAGLLASLLARTADVRLIALARSSRSALALLARGVVHAAGVHLGAGAAGGHPEIVRQAVGGGHRLLRLARWEAGVAVSAAMRPAGVRQLVESDLRWVGREVGSGARACLDELLEGRRPPRRLATDHRGVAEAVRSGWADAGVCLRLVSEEAGLGFLPVRQEDYDLCFPAALQGDHRIEALVRVVRSPAYREALAALPGYDSRTTGELVAVD